ncbi:MAG: tRNA (5-methylaminomethyl-2-thiouridine)(34)-methyltransferase MnmD [Urechidicola sp.]|nr:tRNA (5-methylaminomethyl-2-thiouridine)(34)-methyltransferase MnmD [Urechidicola sp.]
MKREIITTSDGSTTIHIPEWNEQYHSKHGAIQEAYHVFIKNGLTLFRIQKIDVLEIGFGTGLNSFITFIEAEKLGLEVDYVGVEKFPISEEELNQLNYVSELKADDLAGAFKKMHSSSWEEKCILSDNFSLTKREQDFKDIDDKHNFNLIYFDAFGARVQPELWIVEIFQKMFDALKSGGILVTYAAKGSVRRAMIEVGFKVEKLLGPPGKREMLRGKKV